MTQKTLRENLVAQTTTRRLRAAALLAVSLTGALVLSACGSSDDSGSTSAATTSAAAGTSAAMGSESSAMGSESSAMGSESSAMGSESSAMGSESSAASGSEGTDASSSAAVSKVGTTGPAPEALADADLAAAKATLKDQSTLTVCTSLPYSPFESDDGNGNIVGFDIDFMDWLAKDLGVQTKII